MKEPEDMLIAKQISPTAMRLLVLEFLLKQKNAVSLNDVEAGLHRSDRVTIFRTLKTFEEKGLVHNIKDGNEAMKYAICESDCEAGTHYDGHLHFYCTKCKELFCLPKLKVPDISLPANFQLHEISLVAKGICDKCSNNAIRLQ